MENRLPVDFGKLPDGTKISNYLYDGLHPEELHQDLVTIILPCGVDIYVDWFSEYDSQGTFWVRVSRDNDELFIIMAYNIDEVIKYTKGVIRLIGGEQKKNILGKFIEEKLEEKDFSVYDLACITGLSVREISNLISGKITITLDTACLLSQVFRVEKDKLIEMGKE